MDYLTSVKLAIYHHFARTGAAPVPHDIAGALGSTPNEVQAAFTQLRANRVLLLESDGTTIRMAPPFSGVPTQHKVRVGSVDYYANCAWDALGIPAALHENGTVRSRCEQTMEPLHLEVSEGGPSKSDWIFHSLVPAAKWWNDLVFT